MRRVGVVVALASAGLVPLWAVIVLLSAGLGGCPPALLFGTLEAEPSSRSLHVRTDDGRTVSVAWPIGYGIATAADGMPVLTRLFVQVAAPGDRVSMGGGTGQTADFQGCGPIAVTPGSPPPTGGADPE